MAGPKDWIGEQVRITCDHTDGSARGFQARLEAVDETGITVSYHKEGQELTRFYPWNRIWYVHHAKEEPTQKRRAGFQLDRQSLTAQEAAGDQESSEKDD